MELPESLPIVHAILLKVVKYLPLIDLQLLSLANHDLYEVCHPYLWMSQTWTPWKIDKLSHFSQNPRIPRDVRHLRIRTSNIAKDLRITEPNVGNALDNVPMDAMQLILHLLTLATNVTSLSITNSRHDHLVAEALNSLQFPQITSVSFLLNPTTIAPFFSRHSSIRHLLIHTTTGFAFSEAWFPNLQSLSVVRVSHLALIRNRPVSTVSVLDDTMEPDSPATITSLLSRSTSKVHTFEILLPVNEPPTFIDPILHALPSLVTLTLNIPDFNAYPLKPIYNTLIESLPLLQHLTWRVGHSAEVRILPEVVITTFLSVYAPRFPSLQEVTWLVYNLHPELPPLSVQVWKAGYKPSDVPIRYTRDGKRWKQVKEVSRAGGRFKSPFVGLLL